MRLTKKMICLLMVLIFPLLVCFAAAGAEAGTKQNSPIGLDAVVIMDNRWSVMNGNNAADPQGYRFDAMANLFSMCDLTYSRVNYILFNERIFTFSNGNLSELTDKNGLTLLDVTMPFGRAIRFQMLTDLTSDKKLKNLTTNGGADIGTALSTAVDLLKQNDKGNKKMIILMSNGGIAFSKSGRTGRQIDQLLEKSYSAAENAVVRAEENGITIHTILLKDMTAMDLLQNKLKTTDGTFTMVTDAEQLPVTFARIFEKETGTALMTSGGMARETGEIIFNVPNSSAAEMNILVPLKNITPSSMQMTAPDGTVMTDNTDNYYSFASDHFAIFKIRTPAQGDWKLTFNGDGSSDGITAQYLLGYDISSRESLSSQKIGKNDTVTVTANYVKDGITIGDPKLYQIPATVTLSKDGASIKSVKITGTQDGYSHSFGPLQAYGSGEYSVNILYDGSGMQRTSSDLVFTVLNKAPIYMTGIGGKDSHSFIINTPGAEETYAIQNYSWDLSQMVYDPDGDKLTWKLSSVPEGVTASITDSTLTVSTVKNTAADGDVIVSVQDSEGLAGPDLTFHINVSATSDSVDTIVYGPSANLTKTNDTAEIKVQYSINGTTLSTSEYYNIPAYLTLKKDNQVLRSGISMAYDGEAYAYTLTGLSQYGTGTFEACVRLQSGSFVLDCEPCKFTLVNTVPAMIEGMPDSIDCSFEINDPENQQTYQVQSKEYDLKTYAYDPDGDPLTWKIVSDVAGIKPTLAGNILTISTEKNTEAVGDLIVSVFDVDDGAGPSLTFHINVTSVEKKYGVKVYGPQKAVNKNEPVGITAQLTQNDIAVAKDSGMNQIPASVQLKKGEEVIYNSVPMTFANGTFSCTLDALANNGSGVYTALVIFESGNFRLVSAPYEFTLLNSAPILTDGITNTISHEFRINDPTDTTTYQPQSWTYDLNKLVSDENGDTLTWFVKNNEADVKVTTEGSVLTVETKKGRITSGDITLGVMDPEGAEGPDITVSIDVISIETQIGITLTGPVKAVEKQNSVTVKAEYTRSGITVGIADALNQIPMTLTLMKGTEELESNLPMTQNNGEYQYTFDNLSRYGSGDYQAIANSAGADFSFSSEAYSFTVTNSEPVLADGSTNSISHEFKINDPTDASTYQAQTWTYDLSKLVTDANGDILTWTVKNNTADVKAMTDGNVLTVETKKGKVTSGDIILAAADVEGTAGPDITVHIDVVSVESQIGIAVSGPIRPTEKEKSVTIKAVFTRGGTTVSAGDVLNTIPMTLALQKNGEELKNNLAMTQENGEYQYTFDSLTQYGSGTYTVTASAANADYKLISEAFSFELVNTAPQFSGHGSESISHKFEINIPGNSDSYKPISWTINMNDYYADPNGDNLTWQIVSNTADVTAYFEGSELTITTIENKTTSGDITVQAQDNEGLAGTPFVITISVVSIEDVYDQYTAKILPVKDDAKNNDVTLTLSVYDENGNYVSNDSYLPEEITATISDSVRTRETKLIRNENGEYTGAFHTGNISTNYQASSEITVGGKTIKTDTVSFEIRNKAPEMTADLSQTVPGTLMLGLGSDKDIELSNYFADPDGDSLHYIIENNTFGDHAEITVEGSVLKIRPRSGIFCIPFSGSFTVKALDTEDASVSSAAISFTIWPILLILLLALILAAIIFAIIKFNAWKNARFGKTAFDVSYGYMGLTLPDGLSQPLPEGSHAPVTLEAYYTELAENVAGKAISKAELQKITLKPLTKDYIQVQIPDGLNFKAFADQLKYADGAYAGDKEVRRNYIMKPAGQGKEGNASSLYFCIGEYCVVFRLVHIIKNEE